MFIALLIRKANNYLGVEMKTVTMRVNENVYEMIRQAADGQKRNISNFVEFATLQYLTSSQYIDQAEMNDILSDKSLVENLNAGLQDVKNGDYTSLSKD